MTTPCACDESLELRESVKRLTARVLELEAELSVTRREGRRKLERVGLSIACERLAKLYFETEDLEKSAHYLARLRRVERLRDINVGAMGVERT